MVEKNECYGKGAKAVKVGAVLHVEISVSYAWEGREVMTLGGSYAIVAILIDGEQGKGVWELMAWAI